MIYYLTFGFHGKLNNFIFITYYIFKLKKEIHNYNHVNKK